VAACISVLVLAGCAGGTPPKTGDGATSAGGDELRIGMALGDLATLDPARVLADAMQLAIPLYGESLVDVDQKDPSKIVPALAKSWEASADLKTYTFKLRDDVKFSTGRLMTADDVKFSLERVKNIQGASSFKMGIVDSVDVVDPTTVRFNLASADSTFPSRMSAPYLSVFDSEALKKEGAVADKTAVDTDKAQAFMDKTTVGTGPYKLASWNRNESVTFEANPNYWGEAPKFKRIAVQDIREAATQRQLVERGDIDIAMDIEPDVAASLEGKSGVKVVKDQSYNINYIAMSNDSPDVPGFKNVKVRQAIQKAIDYDGISKAFADGAPRPAAVVPLGFLGADSVSKVDYDPAAAKQLLSEAGVSKLNLTVEFANAIWYGVPQQALWEKIKSDLSAVGVEITLRPVEYATWIADYRAGKLPMTSGLWAPEDFDSSSYFDPFGREEGIYGVRTKMDFPIGQKLYEKYLSESDAAKRSEIAVEYITAMRDSATLIPLLQAKKILVHSDSLTGVNYSPNKQITIATITRSS
jgi:peptide/nickel transport system substrate-binding protein